MRTPQQRDPRGFTLVEIVITLFIVMLILGLTALTIGSVSNERYLREVTSSIRDAAKKARAQAIVERRAFQIEFQQGFFRVQALQMVSGEEDPLTPLFVVEGEAAQAEELKRVALPEDIRIDISRWPGTDWMPSVGHTWVFEQSGICEPLSLRVVGPKGFIELHFNALTANVEEEILEIE